METYLGRYADILYAVMRIMVGLMFAQHGFQKVLGMLGGTQQEMFTLMWVAGVIELVGGLMVAVGLFASWAAFISSGQMAVAYFMAHAPDGFWPVQNNGELAVIYCFVFLYIATRGAGRLAIAGS